MFRFLVLSTLVACTFASAIKDATRTEGFNKLSGRIVGGQTAAPGQFPYQASLRTQGNSHFCGGFIISGRTIGTAAHCTSSRTPANTITAVGTNNIRGGTTYLLQSIFVHANYSSQTNSHDISVIITQTSIVFSDLVQPIPLGADFVDSGDAVVSG